MGMWHQLLSGSLYLTGCTIFHAVALSLCVAWIQARVQRHHGPVRVLRRIGFVLLLLLAIVVSLTAEVWLWASALIWRGALPDLDTAVYFTIVTYTTLGYGDIVLDQGHRIFGAMAAVTGLLTFGISTAFLVALWGRVVGSGPGN